ncbi:outer membrane protein assembly factor BamB [Solemya pervernicosa gill symbiont]|uniref:Outer membrane protein assembly factor BamB n=2 Tax=Gammaproteobacteria incertae sedis TaxID=118884 RepID=A0A1T2LAR5_9GAMM|nr:outer membrane protein assembly factor BamB [Candidatus Reidiella endopervernicosa]OOZ42199.1 outer membrane protein assembly factor BamB [Solemya pervernicosa gill symbiont]QKQ27233.1 outer membrane protein assembly factor BamB [Candidatus Reidiella endopervernicosa]
MSKFRFAPLLLSVLLLQGCGSMFLGEDNTAPAAELTDFDTTVKVDEIWERSAGSGSRGDRANLVVALSGERVYAAEFDGDVMAFDANNGDRVWIHDTDSTIGGGVGVGEGLVLVGTSDAEVVALSVENGDELWRSKVSSEVLSVPRAAEGVVVTQTIDGKMFGLDAKDGKRLWIYDRTVPTLTLRGTSSPVLAPGLVISGFASGKLTAISLKDGKPLWERRISVPSGRSELERMVDIDADPLVMGNEIYVSTYQGRVAAVDLLSGKLRWVRELPSRAGLGGDYGQIYVTDDSGHVWALERANGRSIWKQDKLTNRSVSTPAVVGNYVVVGDYEGYLHWMDRTDGHLVARTRVGSSGISAAPIVENEMLFVLGRGGDLAAYKIAE